MIVTSYVDSVCMSDRMKDSVNVFCVSGRKGEARSAVTDVVGINFISA